MRAKSLRAAAACTLAALIAFPPTANALGCNGVVNPLLAGCTRSDNNDGPQFPYYKVNRVSVPGNLAKIEMKDGALMTQVKGKWYPVVSAANGTVVIVESIN